MKSNIEKRWKPQKGETIYLLTFDGYKKLFQFDSGEWTADSSDRRAWKENRVFRTWELMEAAVKEIKSVLGRVKKG